MLDEPSPQQAMYWWQDEIRSVAFAVSTAHSGQVAQWPKMSVPAGQAVLPLPIATGAVRADGHLDEEAWKRRPAFPWDPCSTLGRRAVHAPSVGLPRREEPVPGDRLAARTRRLRHPDNRWPAVCRGGSAVSRRCGRLDPRLVARTDRRESSDRVGTAVFQRGELVFSGGTGAACGRQVARRGGRPGARSLDRSAGPANPLPQSLAVAGAHHDPAAAGGGGGQAVHRDILAGLGASGGVARRSRHRRRSWPRCR